ncbi:hypothetical protein [Streptomyces sp. NPDC048665]|uniref:hypothetical protein n=1 Tax=Streptomyces sp. NPDC048665 TaxID=3155490 RepID=UPI0034230DDA
MVRSRFAGSVDVTTACNRAFRTTVATHQGPLAVYVAHLGSVRVFPRNGFWTAGRGGSTDQRVNTAGAGHAQRA